MTFCNIRTQVNPIEVRIRHILLHVFHKALNSRIAAKSVQTAYEHDAVNG